MRFRASYAAALLPCFIVVASLTGCGAGAPAVKSLNTSTQAGVISGRLMGGQQPVAGAHVYLFASGTGGYGTASSSLLTSGSGTDATGTYVLTDSGGNFSLTGLYTCTGGTEVYAYAQGGSAGSGTNSMIGLLAVLGNCPKTGSDLSAQVPTLIINEASTIAAAYALSGYAVDATHIASSNSSSASNGVYLAALNAAQMNAVNSATGANATTPVGNGAVPQALLNTLGNILAACINSNSSTSTACTTLQTNAASGSAQPTDTATAAINIAHAPAANIAALYSLASAAGPFQPTLNAAPADFTVVLTYPNHYLVGANSLTIDGYGYIWAPEPSVGVIAGVSSIGGSAIYFGDPNVQTPQGVGFDAYENLWFSDNATGSVGHINPRVGGSIPTPANFSNLAPSFRSSVTLDSNGYFATQGTGGGVGELFFSGPVGSFNQNSSASAPYASSVDSNNYFWVTSNAPGTASGSALLQKYKSMGNYNLIDSVTCTGTNYATGTGVVIDSGNNAWVSDSTTNSLVEFSNACAYVTNYPTITAPTGLAIDGIGTLFTINAANRLGATTSSGTAVSPAGGYTLNVTGTLASPAVDLGGNLWLVNSTSGALVEVIGIAAPVITPTALAVFLDKLGQRP